MGQYHKTYNITKREFIHPHRINNGLKLREQMGAPNSTADALFLLLANSNGRGGGDARPHPTIGRWAGDQIVVQGDYADEKDPAFISEEEREGYTDISGMVADMLAGID